MKIEAAILMQDVEQKYQELIPLLEKLKEYVAQNATNAPELADISFVCREVENSTDEFLKRIRDLSRIAQACCCITLAATGEDIVRTDHCTASPNPKPWYKIPYKREQRPEQWDQIMSAIGVGGQPANGRDLVRIYAPGLMTYCGECIGNGGNPPAGINPKEMTSMEINLRITKQEETTQKPPPRLSRRRGQEFLVAEPTDSQAEPRHGQQHRND